MISLFEKLEKVKEETKISLERRFPDIKFSKEIELMDELNKANRKEYEQWLYKRKMIDKILGKKTFLDYAA
jgi:hypothetical protein